METLASPSDLRLLNFPLFPFVLFNLWEPNEPRKYVNRTMHLTQHSKLCTRQGRSALRGRGDPCPPPPPPPNFSTTTTTKTGITRHLAPSETQGILLSRAVKRRFSMVFFPSKVLRSTEWLLNFQALVNSRCQRLANGIERFGLSNMELTGRMKNQLFESGIVLILIFVWSHFSIVSARASPPALAAAERRAVTEPCHGTSTRLL